LARTKALDYDDKRNAILAEAARLFAEEGYDRASMSLLAAACGISKALLYHYYTNKDALLFDVIGGHLQDLNDAVAAADDPGLLPEARLRRLVAALLSEYQDADHQHRVQISAMKFLSPAQQEELKDLERALVARFAEAVKAACPTLDGDPTLLKPVTMSLFGMLNWHYMWFRAEGAISREAYADIATKIIVAGASALQPVETPPQ